MNGRNESLPPVRDAQSYDVVIMDGGINGACLCDLLCRRGYRTLLIDKGDFSAVTRGALFLALAASLTHSLGQAA